MGNMVEFPMFVSLVIEKKMKNNKNGLVEVLKIWFQDNRGNECQVSQVNCLCEATESSAVWQKQLEFS